MVDMLIKEFPLTEIGGSMTEERIKKYTYTKEEVDRMIAHAVQVAVAEAKELMKSQCVSTIETQQLSL